MSAAGRLQPELSEECEQTPDEQVRLPLQVCPHPPQFLRSLEVSTQAPEHVATAFGPAVHVLLQAPQFRTSASVRMQAPPHAVNPSLHWIAHLPWEHVAVAFIGAGHAVAQSPQCPGFVVVSVHAPPQAVCPAGHTEAQAPLVHTWPPPQVLP